MYTHTHTPILNVTKSKCHPLFFSLGLLLSLSFSLSLISLMLQRDASSRATLEEIEGHRWLQGVVLPPHSAMVTTTAVAPLIPHSLTASEHELILQSMRHIASTTDITE